MQISLEEIEDLLIVGEAEAIKNEKESVVDLVLKNPDLIDEAEEEPSVRMGFKLYFRPEPIERIVGLSTELLEESDISVAYQDRTKEGDPIKDWQISTSIQELMECEKNPLFGELEFSHIRYNGKTYTNKKQFFEVFGVDTLATVSFKMPSVIFAKFKKICNRKYGTVSSRLNTLVEKDLEEEIRIAVRKEVFK